MPIGAPRCIFLLPLVSPPFELPVLPTNYQLQGDQSRTLPLPPILEGLVQHQDAAGEKGPDRCAGLPDAAEVGEPGLQGLLYNQLEEDSRWKGVGREACGPGWRQ